MRYRREYVENNAEWFKIYEAKKFTRSDVVSIIQRYNDGVCRIKPFITMEEILNTYEERRDREIRGKKYRT